MIQLGPALQGALLGSIGDLAFTPIPYSVYLNQDWHSHILIAAGLYDTSPNKITLAHKSTDNGETYVVTNVDTTFGIAVSVARINRFAEINISGNAIIAYTSGIFVYWKDGSSPWQSRSLSTIPGGYAGGGFLDSITFDETNNEFIISKNSGIDIFTTADFVSFTQTSASNPNDINADLIVLTVRRIGATFIAYGIGTVSAVAEIWTSADLATWTKFGTDPDTSVVGGAITMNWFNGKFISVAATQTIDRTDSVLHIFHSTDGETWTEVTELSVNPDPLVGGQEPELVLITDSAIEILTNSHVMRSTDGTTFTASLLENNLNESTTPKSGLRAAQAKGAKDRPSTSEAPDHIALMNVGIAQEAGKILHLTQANASPTLGYPLGAATGSDVTFIQSDFSRTQLIDSGFTIKDSSAQCLFAKNDNTRYFEVTINSTAGSLNKIGIEMLGGVNYAGSDNKSIFLSEDLIEATLGDTIVSYTMAVSQVLGFKYDSSAGTLEILVDNVSLHTESNVENARAWVIECNMVSGSAALNIGQDAFIYTLGGTVSWDT